MKKVFNQFSKIFIMLWLLFIGVGNAYSANYVKTSFSDLVTNDVVIVTMDNGSGIYAASNDNGTSKAPSAISVTIVNDTITTDATNIIWTVVKNEDNITFKIGDNMMYCTDSNNGVRVGTNSNNVFSINSDYLYNNATKRYIGVYNNADWRCYTTINTNIKNQTLAFYVYDAGTTPIIKKDTFIVIYYSQTELIKTDTVEDGNTVILDLVEPTSACEVAGWEFAGWAGKKSNIELSDIISGEFIPTQDTILYAVFKLGNGGEEAYILVEEDLADWSGDYLIAYSSTIFADGRVSGTNGMGAKSTSVNPEDNLNGNVVNVNWGDLYNITLEAITGGYIMKTKDGKYNYQTSNSNGLASTNNKTTAEQYPLSITFNSSSDIDISISAGAIFHYNLDGYFRFYRDGSQNNIYMYKRNSTSSYEYDTNPQCSSTPTSIETPQTKSNAYKVIKNGEIQIHRDNKVYNIYGNLVH